MKDIVKFHESSFWSNVLKEWCDINYNNYIYNRSEVLSQSIWLNSHRKIWKQGLF